MRDLTDAARHIAGYWKLGRLFIPFCTAGARAEGFRFFYAGKPPDDPQVPVMDGRTLHRLQDLDQRIHNFG